MKMMTILAALLMATPALAGWSTTQEPTYTVSASNSYGGGGTASYTTSVPVTVDVPVRVSAEIAQTPAATCSCGPNCPCGPGCNCGPAPMAVAPVAATADVSTRTVVKTRTRVRDRIRILQRLRERRATRMQNLNSAGGYGTVNYAPTTPSVHTQTTIHGASARVIHAQGSGQARQAAIQSALFRARNRIRGHSSYDSSSLLARMGFRRSGVGWATNNPRPATCFNSARFSNPNVGYAVASTPHGYYATTIF